ncbi:hypothetical protein [Borrelia sp. P9F1]|uniref:hypothetical protein n=1 Tax=Borrelia sp. P9F1 TaxID=3058374 RepID=UPI002647562D|nr:hypothetical protein [Borrelia sp. P9F1]WKC58505.1 hypothetical protein QYZ68_04820 [Borrelia sp. P9F1]
MCGGIRIGERLELSRYRIQAKVIAERIAEEVGSAIGKSVTEVKALSKDELERFAADAATSAEAAYSVDVTNSSDGGPQAGLLIL